MNRVVQDFEADAREVDSCEGCRKVFDRKRLAWVDVGDGSGEWLLCEGCEPELGDCPNFNTRTWR